MTTDDAGKEEAVRATVADYFDGWFDGDAGRMRRALHPDLAKRSYRPRDDGRWSLRNVTAQQMIDATSDGEGRNDDPAERAWEVRAVEVYGRIASAVVHSVSYIEYIHLVRTDDGWRIIDTLWQPPTDSR